MSAATHCIEIGLDLFTVAQRLGVENLWTSALTRYKLCAGGHPLDGLDLILSTFQSGLTSRDYKPVLNLLKVPPGFKTRNHDITGPASWFPLKKGRHIRSYFFCTDVLFVKPEELGRFDFTMREGVIAYAAWQLDKRHSVHKSFIKHLETEPYLFRFFGGPDGPRYDTANTGGVLSHSPSMKLFTRSQCV